MKPVHLLPTADMVALAALLDTRSVTRSARRLGLTQSALSHALGRLRDHFGDPLLVRAQGGLITTPFADQLVPHLAAALRDLEAVSTMSATFDPASTERSFVLAARDLTLPLFLPTLTTRFASEAPSGSLRVVKWESDTLGTSLFDGAVDLAIGVDPPCAAGIDTRLMFADDFVVVCAAANALPSVLSISDLTARPHVLVTRTDAVASPFDCRLAELGHRRHVILRLEFFLAAFALVAETDFVMVTPRRLARHQASRLAIEIRELPFEMAGFEVAMAWHARDGASPDHRWFRELCGNALVQHKQ